MARRPPPVLALGLADRACSSAVGRAVRALTQRIAPEQPREAVEPVVPVVIARDAQHARARRSGTPWRRRTRFHGPDEAARDLLAELSGYAVSPPKMSRSPRGSTRPRRPADRVLGEHHAGHGGAHVASRRPCRRRSRSRRRGPAARSSVAPAAGASSTRATSSSSSPGAAAASSRACRACSEASALGAEVPQMAEQRRAAEPPDARTGS